MRQTSLLHFYRRLAGKGILDSFRKKIQIRKLVIYILKKLIFLVRFRDVGLGLQVLVPTSFLEGRFKSYNTLDSL